MAFSAFNRYLFKSFQYSLGIGEISKIDFNNKISATLCNNDFIETNSGNFSDINLRVKSLSSNNVKLIPTNLLLNSACLNNYNSETSLPSEISYEEIINRPCSSIIFSVSGNNSWLCNDLDYSVSALQDPYTETYFKTEYNFNTAFNRDEYRIYNIDENIIEENTQCISADDFIINDISGNQNAMNQGIAGLLLSYTDDKHKYGEQIPIVYYEFPKTYFSDNNFLEVDWHADGIIKVN